MRRIVARAPVNIALIKYWGKQDEARIIPYNASLSMTLNNLYTETTIQASEEFSFILNGVKQSQAEAQKVKTFLKNFACDDEINKVSIFSHNHVPTAAGLASSASGFAALTIASNRFFEKDLSIDKLAAISRSGSGSACRSFYGGFVAWESDGSVYQVESSYNDFIMIAVIIETKKKHLSSRVAMKRTVETSPLYPLWVETANHDFIEMKKALLAGKIDKVGELVERSSKLMHATMIAASPPIQYLNKKAIKVWEIVHQLRNEGLYAYATNDAGANVKILTNKTDYQEVIKCLIENGYHNYFVSRVGKGAMIIND